MNFAPPLNGFPFELVPVVVVKNYDDGATEPTKKFVYDIFSPVDTIHRGVSRRWSWGPNQRVWRRKSPVGSRGKAPAEGWGRSPPEAGALKKYTT